MPQRAREAFWIVTAPIISFKSHTEVSFYSSTIGQVSRDPMTENLWKFDNVVDEQWSNYILIYAPQGGRKVRRYASSTNIIRFNCINSYSFRFYCGAFTLKSVSAFLYAIQSSPSCPTIPLFSNSSIQLKPFSFFANG